VVELISDTAMWYPSGMPPLPLRWVLVHDPQGKFEPQALLCTDLTGKPVQIIEWFVLRRCLEVTWQKARARLGMEMQPAFEPTRAANEAVATALSLLAFGVIRLVGGQAPTALALKGAGCRTDASSGLRLWRRPLHLLMNRPPGIHHLASGTGR